MSAGVPNLHQRWASVQVESSALVVDAQGLKLLALAGVSYMYGA